MKIKFKTNYFIGISIGIVILIVDFLYFLKTRWFFTIIIFSLSIGWAQFWMDFFKEQKRQKEIETKFLEFVRSIVGTVSAGSSIPQALKQTSKKDYGALTKYTKKLANQLEWGIPVQDALITFSNDTGNKVIKRAISIVIEAEKSGGNIQDVLESVTDSVVYIKKMKAERKSETYSQVVQGYIVFFVFIAIMLLLQLQLFPLLQGMSVDMAAGGGALGSIGGGMFGQGATTDLNRTFFALVLIQGFFAGIMIGKFSEGTFKQGLVHSLALTTISALIVTTVNPGSLMGGV